MLSRDLADSPVASHRPDIEGQCDTARDLLAEPFIEYRGPLPQTQREFRDLSVELLDRGLDQVAESGGMETGPDRAAVVSILQLVAGDENRTLAMRAACYLRLLNADPRTLEEIGKEYGVVRATVHSIYRAIQRRHDDMRARGDKCDAARAACRQRRLGARKARSPWSLSHLWKRPLLASI